MIVTWMLYCMAASALLGLSALALEQGCRLNGWPRRWVWAAGLLGSLGLSLLPWVSAPSPVAHGSVATTAVTEALVRERPLDVGGREVTASHPSAPSARAALPFVEWLDAPLILLWIMFAGAGTAFLIYTHRRLVYRRRKWCWARVDGVCALLSEDTGPAVVGFLDGAIVVPRWVTAMDEERRRLVITHEEEHLRAGDPRLLIVGLAVLALVPWNAALWWQVRRLRHAIELDCDARVLARCPDRWSYGSLLLDVGQRASESNLSFAAFSESSSLLEKRIRAMFHRKPRGWRTLVGICAVFSLLLGAFACEVPLPTMPLRDATPTSNAEPAVGERATPVLWSPPLPPVRISSEGFRVRTAPNPDEREPPSCSMPYGHNGIGQLIWPGCSGAIIYSDTSMLPARVFPVMGRVRTGGPASIAGLREGDVLLAVNGDDARLLLAPFRVLHPGTRYRLRVCRGHREHIIEFQIGPDIGKWAEHT